LNFLASDVPAIMSSMALGVMAIAAGIAMIKSSALPTKFGWFSVLVGILGALPIERSVTPAMTSGILVDAAG
jgi:hypothetical protein